MFSLRISLVLTALLVGTITSAQKLKKADRTTLANLKAHVAFLADDKLEGRRTGTSGEKLAMEYISTSFKKAGLSPKGTEGYYQAFPVNDGKQINDEAYLEIDGQ